MAHSVAHCRMFCARATSRSNRNAAAISRDRATSNAGRVCCLLFDAGNESWLKAMAASLNKCSTARVSRCGRWRQAGPAPDPRSSANNASPTVHWSPAAPCSKYSPPLALPPSLSEHDSIACFARRFLIKKLLTSNELLQTDPPNPCKIEIQGGLPGSKFAKRMHRLCPPTLEFKT